MRKGSAVATILLVATNSEETEEVRRELQPLGHEVTVAPGSFYALTLLERHRPDVLVAWPDVGEPPADELCAILRQDPAMERIRLVLVRPDGLAAASMPDVIVVRPGSPADIAGLLGRLVPSAPPPGGSAPDAADTQPISEVGALVGRLDTIQLVHLVQALAQLRRTGCLRVMFFSAESCSYFQEGRLVHATFGELVGEEALQESLLEAEVQPGAMFAFDRYDAARIAQVPATVTARLEKVLLDTSAHLDERRSQAKSREEG
jgi:CheY-like chemotaxis protein